MKEEYQEATADRSKTADIIETSSILRSRYGRVVTKPKRFKNIILYMKTNSLDYWLKNNNIILQHYIRRFI